MHFLCVAHQMVIVRALGSLARSHISEYLRQPAVRSNVNERGASSVIFSAAYGDGFGITRRVVIE